MTSHQFFKMAAATWHFYFRFRFSWLRSFGKVVIYLQTKFRRDISIHGSDITTFGFWKKRPPCWNSTSGFDFHVCITIGMSFWTTLEGRGHNPLIWNILKTVTDTRLDPRKDFFERRDALSIGTIRFNLGWPWGVKNQAHIFDMKRQ